MPKAIKKKSITFEETLGFIKSKLKNSCDKAFKQAISHAKEYTDSVRSTTDAERISTYVDAIRADHLSIQSELESELNGEELLIAGGFDEQANKKQLIELEDSHRASIEEIDQLREDHRHLSPVDVQGIARVNLVLGIIAVAEGALTSVAIHSTTTSLLQSAVVLVAFTVVYYGIPKAFIAWLRYLANKVYRRAAIAGTILILGCLYFTIAQLRSAGEASYNISPWMFVLVNFAFLGVALFYALRRKALEVSYKDKKAWKEFQSKKKELELKIESVDQQTKHLKEQHELAQQNRLRLLASINNLNKQVDMHFLKSVERFKAEVRRRKGACAPDINDPVEPINFKEFNVINELKSLQS